MRTDVVLDEVEGILRLPLSLLERAASEEGVLAHELGPTGDLVSATVTAAVSEPVATLVVEVLHPAANRCPGWIAEHAAVIAMPASDDLDPICDVIVVSPVALTLRLAKLVALGPRPSIPVVGLLTVERTALDVLLDSGEANVDVRDALALAADVPSDVVRAVAAIVPSFRLHWRVAITWETEAGRVERALEVIDAGAGGLWLVADAGVADDARAGAALIPCSGTAVWTMLTALLPSDEDLAGSAEMTIEGEIPDDDADWING